MKAPFAPSLTRRVLLALLAAFALTWAVLLAVEVSGTGAPADLDRVIATFGDGLLADLAASDSADEARGIVLGLDRSTNRSYRENGLPTVLALQLLDRDGRVVHASGTWRDALAGAAPGASRVDVDGRVLHLWRGSGPRWTVVIGQPEIARPFIVRMLAAELTRYMLIALPLVLLPLWIAVSQGLKPLRRLSRAVAARDPDDLAPTGLVARHRELQPLVAAIDDLLARLRAKVAREQAFVHDAAHELRTPMAVISAQVHALAQAGDEGARREAESHLDASIARASNLVDQLLALARLDDARAPRRETLDVAALAQQELALLVPRALAKGLELGLDAPESLAAAVEPAAFRSILHNLVVNAIHYVPAGGQVEVALAAHAAGLVLRVTDDGPGIAPGLRATVFDRFVRGAGHDVAGSGLGLAIVRQAARRMGGDVVLRDGPHGRGCLFEVTLAGAGEPPR
jgi:signal transduction histidine kinase